MKIIKIRKPQGNVRIAAPLSAINAMTGLCKIYGESAKALLVDVSFSPEHENTIYVWQLWTATGEKVEFIWSDEFGNAGLADADGLLTEAV